jgi:peptide alpha-N-acetyltransferase
MLSYFTEQVFPSDAEAEGEQERKRAIATIVCKQDCHKGLVNRGYIAMLSVDKAWRRKGIGEHDLQ